MPAGTGEREIIVPMSSTSDLKKFVTVSLPSFLLLAGSDPNVLFDYDDDDERVRDLSRVVVMYDVQSFFKNGVPVAPPNRTAIDMGEFVSYCESKIQCRFAGATGYRCCMTVSDLIRTEPWAWLYGRVGPAIMKFLLFNCLLFVPIQDDVYYCVHTPSQQAGRHEVISSFWTMAGSRSTARKRADSRYIASRRPTARFNIAGLLHKGVGSTTGREDPDAMLHEILRTDCGGGAKYVSGKCFDVLKRKLKVMADKDSSLSTYQRIYADAIDGISVGSADIPSGRIKKFAGTVVRKIVPRELFGTDANRNQYCGNLDRILNGGRCHEFTVEHVVHGIKTKRVGWLDGLEANRRTEIMAKMLVWLTVRFVFGRIAWFFQIASTNSPQNGIAYYTKPSWTSMCHRKMGPLLNGRNGDGGYFEELGPAVPEPSPDPYNVWKVCPFAKPDGVRLIFKPRFKETGDAKKLTDHCLSFLQCLIRTFPARFRTVYRSQFFRGWTSATAAQQFRRDDGGPAVLYYVRTDLQDAFTSIEHSKLHAVILDRIRVHFGDQSSLDEHSVNQVKIGDGGGNAYCRKRTFFDGLPAPEFPAGSLIIYDKTTTIPLSQIWDTIRNRIRRNAVVWASHRWAMTRGIVQGDRLSVALCNLLLADLQATRLREYAETGGLYRYIDDYVLVTPDRATARRFLTDMHAGFAEYGVQLNRTKTETNVDRDAGGGSFKFLGYLMDAATGHVTRDEAAFRNRRPLHFFDYGLSRGRPGRGLYARMIGLNQHVLPVQLIGGLPITAARILASIVAHKAFIVLATVKQYFLHVNPGFLIRTVHAVARAVSARVRHLPAAVSPKQCKWIVYEVYSRVFRRHFSKATNHWIGVVLDRIRERQTAIGRRCDTLSLKVALRQNYDFTKMFS